MPDPNVTAVPMDLSAHLQRLAGVPGVEVRRFDELAVPRLTGADVLDSARDLLTGLDVGLLAAGTVLTPPPAVGRRRRVARLRGRLLLVG